MFKYVVRQYLNVPEKSTFFLKKRLKTILKVNQTLWKVFLLLREWHHFYGVFQLELILVSGKEILQNVIQRTEIVLCLYDPGNRLRVFIPHSLKSNVGLIPG